LLYQKGKPKRRGVVDWGAAFSIKKTKTFFLHGAHGEKPKRICRDRFGAECSRNINDFRRARRVRRGEMLFSHPLWWNWFSFF
jgi:hypothetical protein